MYKELSLDELTSIALQNQQHFINTQLSINMTPTYITALITGISVFIGAWLAYLYNIKSQSTLIANQSLSAFRSDSYSLWGTLLRKYDNYANDKYLFEELVIKELDYFFEYHTKNILCSYGSKKDYIFINTQMNKLYSDDPLNRDPATYMLAIIKETAFPEKYVYSFEKRRFYKLPSKKNSHE